MADAQGIETAPIELPVYYKGKIVAHTLIDQCNKKLSCFRWRLNGDGYAVRSIGSAIQGSYVTIFLHRVVLGLQDPITGSQLSRKRGDHRKGNRLDNRLSQLRIATNQENLFNRGANKNNTSGFKGVCWSKNAGKWSASIRVKRKAKHLGYFRSKIAAAKAYNRASRKLHGEFAFQNPI